MTAPGIAVSGSTAIGSARYDRTMLRLVVIAAIVTAAGCALDPHRNDRPARLRLGTNARRFTTPTPDPVAFRAAGSTQVSRTQNGITASGQFTMATSHHLYVGGELEAGRLEERGSNVAGAYAISGAQHVGKAGSLGLELAGGWRALRYSLDADDLSKLVVEPRLRGELWLSPRLTLGATAGATLGEGGVWMAGVYIGVHSHLFGARRAR